MTHHPAPQYAVFGRPIHHSKSPKIHCAFAKSLGFQVDYRAIEVPTTLNAILPSFRANGGVGANVTAPFKEEAYQVADHRHPAACQAGAANTLWWDEHEQLHADNTDGIGLLRDLHQKGIGNLSQKSVLLLGAGGAARGVLANLCHAKPKRLVIANRTAAKLKQWISSLPQKNVLDSTVLESYTLEQLSALSAFDLIINATSATLADNNDFMLPNNLVQQDSIVYDMIYGRDTPILQWAQKHHLQYFDGLGMLVEQAAESFERWHHRRPETLRVLQMLRSDSQAS